MKEPKKDKHLEAIERKLKKKWMKEFNIKQKK